MTGNQVSGDAITRSVALVACLGGLTVAAIILRSAFKQFRELRDSLDRIPEVPASPERNSEVPEASEALLERIRAIAREDDGFREAWESVVRLVSDAITARLAGAWMASGVPDVRDVPLVWEGNVTLPEVPGTCPQHAWIAFQRAVQDEVSRRVQAMNGPGALG